MDYLQYVMFASLILGGLTDVLNLVINGLPSIQITIKFLMELSTWVLNLVINGLPSILLHQQLHHSYLLQVLNLVINGLPSIQKLK